MKRSLFWASLWVLICLFTALLIGEWLTRYEQIIWRDKWATEVEDVLLSRYRRV